MAFRVYVVFRVARCLENGFVTTPWLDGSEANSVDGEGFYDRNDQYDIRLAARVWTVAG